MGKGTFDTKYNRKVRKNGLKFFMLGSGGGAEAHKAPPGSVTELLGTLL